jgi:hypothetical protein
MAATSTDLYHDITALVLEHAGADAGAERIAALPEEEQAFWRTPAVIQLLRDTRARLWQSRKLRGVLQDLGDAGDPAVAQECHDSLVRAFVEGVTACLAQVRLCSPRRRCLADGHTSKHLDNILGRLGAVLGGCTGPRRLDSAMGF